MQGLRIRIKPDEIACDNLNGAYRDLSYLLGVQAVLLLHETYRGQTISLPVELFDRTFIAERIAGEYNGHNIKQLATRYAYSEKWIRKILKEYNKV